MNIRVIDKLISQDNYLMHSFKSYKGLNIMIKRLIKTESNVILHTWKSGNS